MKVDGVLTAAGFVVLYCELVQLGPQSVEDTEAHEAL